MISLPGANIGSSNFGEISKVADLIYYEGPLLSLFRNNEGENLLFYWCDSDDECNRWLVCVVTDSSLEAYLNRDRVLKDIIQNPKGGFLYCLDYNKSLEEESALIVSPKELPDDYLPADDSFYEEEPIVNTADAASTLKVAINGDWNFFDLNYFPVLFREAYAFVCHFADDLVVRAKLPHLPMRDGLSVYHFFKDTLKSLPQELSPSLRGIRYASPGAIVFNVDRRAAQALLPVLEAFRESRSAIKTRYSILYDTLVDSKLLGKNALVTNIDATLSASIGTCAIDLARVMRLPNPERILEKTSNALLSAKIILAYYRLVQNRLLAYERDQKISIPTLP